MLYYEPQSRIGLIHASSIDSDSTPLLSPCDAIALLLRPIEALADRATKTMGNASAVYEHAYDLTAIVDPKGCGQHGTWKFDLREGQPIVMAPP
jgi:hypothetical protein